MGKPTTRKKKPPPTSKKETSPEPVTPAKRKRKRKKRRKKGTASSSEDSPDDDPEDSPAVSVDSQFTHGNYTGKTPYFYKLAYNDKKEHNYEPFNINEKDWFGPEYCLPHGIEPTIESLSELILPDKLLKKYWNNQTSMPISKHCFLQRFQIRRNQEEKRF